MAAIRNGRISTSFKYAKIAAIPEFSLDSLEREYSDGGLQSVAASVPSSVTSTRAKNEYRKISRTEGCFITKQPGYHLEKAHWVNAVQKDASLKANVESFLEDLGIVTVDDDDSNFSLDGACNLTPLDRNLHYTLDKLGFFAVTCSKATLESLISWVDKENKEWDRRNAVHAQYTRFFPLGLPPFTEATYELVLLNPRHFLQKGSALTVYTEDSGRLSGKLYVVSPDGALREGADNNMPRLPAFASNRARKSTDVLNPFLVALNAEIAFRRFKRRPQPLCAEYEELIKLTIDLMDKIYYKPIVNRIERRKSRRSVSVSKDADGDVNMGEGVDEHGVRTTVDKDKTKTRKDIRKNSRMGTVVKAPGPDASHAEIVEYRQYLMSGCDYVDDEDAEDSSDEDAEDFSDEDAEDDEDEDDENGPIHSGGQDVHAAFKSPIDSLDKVQQWRVAAQVA